jgi:hypothetical protein
VPSVRSGYDTYFGLNGPANILFSLGYGIRDNLSVTIGHAKEKHAFELSVSWLILTQGNLPVSISVIGGGCLFTEPVPCERIWRQENVKYNFQAIVSRQFSDKVSILLVPTFSTNTNIAEPGEENSVAIGTGGRCMIVNNFSIIGEWSPVLSGYKSNFNSWGFGIEYKLGGHVFQIITANSTGLTRDRYITGGDLDITNQDFRLGFNIFRIF